MERKMEYHNPIEEQVASLNQQLIEEATQEFLRLLEEGYIFFRFFSSYYGAHEECGEGDLEAYYLFKQSVKGVRDYFVLDFSHGHTGENINNERFQDFLSGLDDEDYIVFDPALLSDELRCDIECQDYDGNYDFGEEDY